MIPSIESDRTRRDVYVVVAFFCTISVIALPLGAFLFYRAWKVHRGISGDE